LRKAAVRLKRLSAEQQDTTISGACAQAHANGLHVDGCCFAAAYGIRPWTPWIWGILDFRSIRVQNSALRIIKFIPFVKSPFFIEKVESEPKNGYYLRKFYGAFFCKKQNINDEIFYKSHLLSFSHNDIRIIF
jgi:hypothetical protein